jgi:hypothetical protein
MKEITANLFWVGNLSIYEYKCIQSFVKQGFITYVWTYGDLDLPPGVVQKDANLIMPESEFNSIKLNNKPNPSCASDFFRFNLLIKEGGWWFDCDCFAMKPAEDFAKLSKTRQLIIGNSHHSHDVRYVNTGTIYCNNLDIIKETLDISYSKLDKNNNLSQYLDAGGYSIAEVIKKYKIERQVFRSRYFNPCPWGMMRTSFDPQFCQSLKNATENSFIYHFYNSGIPSANKTKTPPVGSFIEYLFNTLTENS